MDGKIHEIILQEIQQPLWDSWYIKEEIGRGASSVVYRIEAKREQRTDVSALKIEPLVADEDVYTDPVQRADFLEKKRIDAENETTIMYKLRRSPYIVWYEDEAIKPLKHDGKELGYYLLIRMEFLHSVQQLMKARKFDTSEENVAKLAVEIGSGIKAAHDFGVIHRDIKPGNFFVDDDGTYKLGDFNISKKSVTSRSFAGTEGYIAPEIYRAKYRSDMPYTAQADIYSFGIALYCMMNDYKFPFGDKCLPDVAIERRMNGEKLPPPRHASPNFARIILKACEYGLNQRYKSMDEMLEDLKAYYASSDSTVLLSPENSDTIVVLPKGLSEEQTANRLNSRIGRSVAANAAQSGKPTPVQPMKQLRKNSPSQQQTPPQQYQQNPYQQQNPQYTGYPQSGYPTGQNPAYPNQQPYPQQGYGGAYPTNYPNQNGQQPSPPYVNGYYGENTYGGDSGNSGSETASKFIVIAVVLLLMVILGGLLFFVLRPKDDEGDKALDEKGVSYSEDDMTTEETEPATEEEPTTEETTTTVYVKPTTTTTVTAYTMSITTAKTTTTSKVTTTDKKSEAVLYSDELTLNVGMTGELTLVSYPDGSGPDDALWSSSNSKIATVDKKGRVTAVKEGECMILVTFSNNKNVSAVAKITVTAPTDPTSGNVGAANIANGGYACTDGETIYISDGTNLYTVSGNDLTTVKDSVGAIYINPVGNKLYFCNSADNNKLCSVNKDGSGYKVINDAYTYELIYYKDWLYFSELDGNTHYISRMKPNGGNHQRLAQINCWYMTIYNDRIYYVNYDKGFNIESMALDGAGTQTVVNDECSDLCIDGGKIYFASSRESRWLYSANIDGSDVKLLRDEYTKNINVKGNVIYCTDENSNLNKVSTDGITTMRFTKDQINFLVVIGGYVYYQSANGELYTIEAN